ncbi:MAG TPA: UDP-N-acetylmuramoyl-L-alanine--D-glutamate ligase [Chlamydiales bacterium]|nr:UDP-N-acetylmuramoyl-L-alanine--D-glutamate ligase [Chlamydiales bacterium]
MVSKALVIGLGISGRAAAALLLAKGFAVTAADHRFEILQQDPRIRSLIEKGLVVCSDQGVFRGFSLAVLSPGIEWSHPLVCQMRAARVTLITEIELALRYLPNDLILGVTGSNGKTTTVLLTVHILNAAGKKAQALGNIGTALSDYALQADKKEVLVIELSSFQLQMLSIKPYFDAALILNITPNHLNRHASMQEYIEAKLRLASCLKPNGKLFISKQVMFAYIRSDSQVFDDGRQRDRDAKDVRLGMAEWENVQAARALCSFCKVPKKIFDVSLKSFRKPPHRIEWVAEINGVAYYNDSKASNVDAVLHAVKLFEGSILLIAGGVDKGAPYIPWIEGFQGKVKQLIVYGEAAEKMERELQPYFPLERVATLLDAVQIAVTSAKPQDTVLFSPGCSSYDQFTGYEQRGDAFKKELKKWTEKKLSSLQS